jgi:hypothetical protein
MLLTYVSIFYLPLAFCAVRPPKLCFKACLTLCSQGTLGHSKSGRSCYPELLHCDFGGSRVGHLASRLQSRKYHLANSKQNLSMESQDHQENAHRRALEDGGG